MYTVQVVLTWHAYPPRNRVFAELLWLSAKATVYALVQHFATKYRENTEKVAYSVHSDDELKFSRNSLVGAGLRYTLYSRKSSLNWSAGITSESLLKGCLHVFATSRDLVFVLFDTATLLSNSTPTVGVLVPILINVHENQHFPNIHF